MRLQIGWVELSLTLARGTDRPTDRVSVVHAVDVRTDDREVLETLRR